MRKYLLYLLITAAFALGACGGSATQPVDVEPASEEPYAAATQPPATQAPQASATSEPQAPGPTATGAQSSAQLASMGCTVQSTFPTPGPTQQSLFPQPTGDDWVSGPESAAITLMEYSDFQ